MKYIYMSTQITRVNKGKEHAEVAIIIGPIPVNDGICEEITSQITTTMKTNKTFYTDSNGRDLIKRIRDFRTDWDLQANQLAAENDYPVSSLHVADLLAKQRFMYYAKIAEA